LWLHKHPNIWNFIKKIKVEESTTLIKFHNISNGILKTKSRSTKDVTRDEDILKCKFELVTKKLNIMDYLIRVSSLIHDFGAKNVISTSSVSTSSASKD
jgi:hypothetical protein